MPIISVVIPTYNRLKFVTKTIASLLDQKADDFEIIVVDDGSTDQTEQHFSTFSHPKVSYHKIVNSERGYARNYGARCAVGEYVNFFDSDDLAFDNHISTALEAISNLGKPELFHLNYKMQTADGYDLDITRAISDNIGDSLINKGNILSCNGVFIRKDIALQFPFCESRVLSGTEDFALWLILSSRFKIHYIPQITSVIIQHEQRSMASHDVIKMINRNMFLLDYLQTDRHFMNYVSSRFNLIKCECFSFIALHLILEGNNKDGLYFLVKAIAADWTFPFRRIRFMAIVKHLLKTTLRFKNQTIPEAY
jgi:glycosyltransferase involved in cell wall biosynthesis